MTKTLAEKFFIKPGYALAVLHAPENYLKQSLAPLPQDVTVSNAVDGTFDQIHFFVTSKTDLLVSIDRIKAGLKQEGVLWICYPKGGNKAKVETDLNRDKIWEMLKPYDVTPNRQIAIDDTWSALRFKIDD